MTEADEPTFSMMLTAEQREIRDWVHNFAADVIRPAAIARCSSRMLFSKGSNAAASAFGADAATASVAATDFRNRRRDGVVTRSMIRP